MARPEPLRGEVWDVSFPAFGVHPAVVLSINSLNARLGHAAFIPITGTQGPEGTHLALNADAGLTRYGESYADVTALQPLPEAAFSGDVGFWLAPRSHTSRNGSGST